MPVLKVLVRYGYVPFMLLGLNGAAFWVVSPTIEVGDAPIGAASGSAIKRRY